MSKYTTQLRFICENVIGKEESGVFEDIESTIEEAAPKIFNFPFPVFDEAYRLPLEIKILRHYFMREIGFETIGEFKYYLSRKLNEIMPYYNQLYRSELLEFNPLHDVDLWTDHKRDIDGRTTGDTQRLASETDNRNLTRSVDDVYGGERLTDNTTTDNGTVDFNGNEHATEDTTSQSAEVRDGSKITSGNRNGTTNEQYGKQTSGEANGNRVTGITDTITENTTDNVDTTTNGTTDKSAQTHGENESTEDKRNFDWDLFSDTPQGSVKIFGEDVVTGRFNADPEQGQVYNPHNDDIIDTVAGESYLTTARRLIGHGVTVANGSNDGTATEHTTVSGTENKVGRGTKSVSKNASQNEETTDNTSGSESGNKTTTSQENYSENVATHERIDGNTTGNRVNDGSREENTVSANTNKFDGKITDATRRDTDTAEGENRQQNLNETVANVGTIKNTEDYIEHIAGKRGMHSYGRLLIEWRESFLNIDKMLLDELEILFFGLW